MATLVAFSARGDDYVLVKEDLKEAEDKLGIGNRSPAGFCQLTQVVNEKVFDPPPILINPERVAYLETTAGG